MGKGEERCTGKGGEKKGKKGGVATASLFEFLTAGGRKGA